jgi:hydroxymethylpyrimidine/phosphomethylpyrimidine kinase
MGANVDKWPVGAEDTLDLAQQRREIVDVRVGPHRDDGVEALVVERELGRVGLNELEPAFPRQSELILGKIDPKHLPALLCEGRSVCPGAATDVEQAPRRLSEQLQHRIARLASQLPGCEHAVIPLGNAVVTRAAHATDASLGIPGCLVAGAENTPAEPDPGNTGEGRNLTPRCLTIAGSDSGGGAGIQADLKAFAAAGCFGTSAIVALTAQNTLGVTAVQELPPSFVEAQLEAVFSDIGVDAAKTGMLFSRELIETVADFLSAHAVPLVVDPVMVASSGAKLLEEDAVEVLVGRLFPLATVVTPNLMEAEALGETGTRRELAERIHELGAPAVIVTGGHGEDAIDHLFDGERHIEIEVDRHEVAATHGAGCTHSATLAALLARGSSLEDAARGAARAAAEAVRNGLVEIGAGEGPVNVLG